MSDYVGPQQASPFDNLSEEQKAHLDKALSIANGVQLYKAAGGAGVGAQWKPYAEQLAKRGGLSEQEALLLAKYKMWKSGAPVIPETRTPALTPEQIDANRNAFINGDPATRARLMDESKAAIYNSELGHFDSLVEQKEKEAEQPVPASQPVSVNETKQKVNA
jgi:hypothetical protein